MFSLLIWFLKEFQEKKSELVSCFSYVLGFICIYRKSPKEEI